MAQSADESQKPSQNKNQYAHFVTKIAVMNRIRESILQITWKCFGNWDFAIISNITIAHISTRRIFPRSIENAATVQSVQIKQLLYSVTISSILIF